MERRPGGASRTIGFVLRQSAEHVAADALLPETLRGIAAAAHGGDYRVLVEPLPPGGGTYEAIIQSHHADGLILSGPRSDDAELEVLALEGYPIVVQGGIDGSPVPSVDIDNRAAARAAVEHLISLGHRDIACVTNAPFAYTAAAERHAGYRDALEAAGIEVHPTRTAEGDFDAPSGHAAMRRILHAGERPPTAVFVGSDVVAFGVYGALREAGLRIPTDVSVVGFDDIALGAYADPPITTVRLPAFELGETAGRLLLDILAGRTVPNRTLLKSQLVVRASADRPREG